ncbi:MAG TPA: hypothetical protein DD640_02050 [Clostridiales bacterium]|nr:hypothetical protein [Clostridiales bacterium]
MAIKEGRCPNCGSILQLDSVSEKGHCIFCDAVFASKQAIEIAENPKDVVFPNTPQPKYEGPSLEPHQGPSAQAAVRQKLAQPVKKAKPAPVIYIPKDPVKLPDIRLSKKIKLRILAISLAVIILTAGVGIPAIIARDQDRASLFEAMKDAGPFPIDTAKAMAVRRNDNSYLLIASGQSVSQEDMIALFRAFCEERAALREIDLNDFRAAYGRVTVEMVTPDGGFLIDQPESLAALNDGSAVTVLEK